jgi:hypothetical protein
MVCYLCLYEPDVQLSDIFLEKFNTASRRTENSKMLSNCKLLTPPPFLSHKNPGSKTTYITNHIVSVRASMLAVCLSLEIYINSLIQIL